MKVCSFCDTKGEIVAKPALTWEERIAALRETGERVYVSDFKGVPESYATIQVLSEPITDRVAALAELVEKIDGYMSVTPGFATVSIFREQTTAESSDA